MNQQQNANGEWMCDALISLGPNDYLIRFTMLAGRTDESGTYLVHVDFQNQSDLSSGRYENVLLEPRGAQSSVAALQGQWSGWQGLTLVPSVHFP